MTSADDALFEPLNGGPVFSSSSTGISKRPDSTAIDIISSNPKQLYLDAAAELIDLAVKCYPQWIDVRLWPAGLPGNPPMHLPAGALRLDTLVDRFHAGNKEFWVACPGLTAPKQFDFAGRFGHFKVWRFAQQMLNSKVAQFVADWFWIDSTDGQMSAIELGVIVLHPNVLLHHIFSNRTEADAYFKT